MQSCNLSHSDVFSCGDSLWLQQRLVNLSELILSNALITSWCTVAAIVSSLPVLETLDVSHNALQISDTDRNESQPVLSSSLAQIILNSTVRARVPFFMGSSSFIVAGFLLARRAVPAHSIPPLTASASRPQSHQVFAHSGRTCAAMERTAAADARKQSCRKLV